MLLRRETAMLEEIPKMEKVSIKTIAVYYKMQRWSLMQRKPYLRSLYKMDIKQKNSRLIIVIKSSKRETEIAKLVFVEKKFFVEKCFRKKSSKNKKCTDESKKR